MTNQRILFKPEDVIALGLRFRQGSYACTSIVEQIKHIIQQLPEGWCGNRASTVLEQTVADMESYQQLIARTQLFGKSLVEVAHAMKATDANLSENDPLFEFTLSLDMNRDGVIDDKERDAMRRMDMDEDHDFDGDDYDTIQRQISGGIGLDVNGDRIFDAEDRRLIRENDFDGDGDYDLVDRAAHDTLFAGGTLPTNDPTHSAQLIEEIKERFDANDDGIVTEAERAYTIMREDLESRWDQYDYSGNGSRDEDDAILQQYDDNRDGVVNGNDDSVRDSWMDNPTITGTPPASEPPSQPVRSEPTA